MIGPTVHDLGHWFAEKGLPERRRRNDHVDMTPAAAREEPPPVAVFGSDEDHIGREAFAQIDQSSHHQNLTEATKIPETTKIGVAMLAKSFALSIEESLRLCS